MSKNKTQQPRHKKKSRTTTKRPPTTGGDTLSLLQRVQRDPASLSTQDMLTLQNTIGNQAVQRLMMARKTAAIQRQPAQEKSAHDTQKISNHSAPDNQQHRAIQRVNFLNVRQMHADYVGEDTGSGGTVEYHDEDEQQETLVRAFGGNLWRVGGPFKNSFVRTEMSRTVHSGTGWEIFVMNAQGELHMSDHVYAKKHHSSLLAGSNVAAAGEMKVKDGKIQELNNKSGHYRPGDEHIQQILKYLEKRGSPLDFKLDLSMGGGGVYTTAKAYWDATGLDEYEGNKTLQMWKHCAQKLDPTNGEDALEALFTKKGWTVVTRPSDVNNAGSFTKKRNQAATPKEVRTFMKDNVLTEKKGGLGNFFKNLFSGKVGTAFKNLFSKKIKHKANPKVT